MLNYVNGFSCAMDNEKGDFIIDFVQRIPKFEDESMQEDMVVESVASLVMNKIVAGKLLSALHEMLDVDIEVEEGEERLPLL